MSLRRTDPREVCFDMLFEVYEKGGYAQLVVNQSVRKTPFLNDRDKSFAIAIFYGVITRTFTIDYLIEQIAHRKVETLDPSVRIALRMGIWQILFSESIPEYAAVHTSVKIVSSRNNPGGKSLVNAVLRVVGQNRIFWKEEISRAKPYVRFSLSKEIAGLLIKWYGEAKANSIADAMLGDARVTARVNVLKNTREELVDLLKSEGVSAKEGLFCEQALNLSLNGMSVEDLKTFRDGRFMIQDEAAMLTGIVAHPHSGQRILDVCAAPGGKSCHLAELSLDQSEVLALDNHESRLRLINDNAHRLGIRSIRTGLSDATNPDTEITGPEKSYDLVLADVPCSGLGLLMRKPDIRIRLSYERIQSMIKLQKEILLKSSAYVAPGKTLVYSTCTINPEENENQVGSFINENPDFEITSISEDLPAELLSGNERNKREAQFGSILLLPDEVACDGFFIAKMRRKSD
ncbi:MAG: 16S rRNA (cytosine(967)-C(5))-methyltransferase RsmB [Clostridiaceae bacterium]|nr:16S rRNA (cytosine(967)-C(5))-methyltransferase RsmB [Clostridiaceae bacterium]